MANSKLRTAVGGTVMGVFLLIGAFSIILPIVEAFDGGQFDEFPDYLPFLGEAEATELAGTLAAASRQQDVCYGWRLEVHVPGYTPHVERGTMGGPGTQLKPAACQRWLALDATVTYTSESSESEDSASFQVVSGAPENTGGTQRLGVLADDLVVGVPDSPAPEPLRMVLFSSGDDDEIEARLGYTAEDLLGDIDDVAFYNLVASLPVLAAEEGLAEPVTVQPNTQPIPAGDSLTNPPGSDYLRENLAALIALSVWVVICFGGMAALVRSSRRRRRGTSGRRRGRSPKPATAQPATERQPSADTPLGRMERLAAEERRQNP